MRLLTALLLIAAAQSARAQDSPDPATRAALVAAREAVWRAYFQGDSAALVQLLPERMTAMGRDRADIIRDSQGFVKAGGGFVRMEFTQDEFFVNGNTAILWSRYVAHTTMKGKPNEMSGRAIELFVKENGRWINPHWHLDTGR